jgi:hypothetical protein
MIAGYKIRVNGGAFTDHIIDVGLVDPTEYLLTGLTAGTEYTIEVASYDAWGNQSDWSAPESYTTPVIPEIPSDFPALTNWYRAKDISGVSNGDPLGSWPDSEGSADLASSGTNRPTYQANSGQPYIEFDGSNDFIEGSIPTTTGSMSVILIVEIVSNASDYTRVFEYGGFDDLIMFSIGGSLYFYINGSGLIGTLPTRPTGFLAIYMERTGTSGRFRINGTEVTGTVDGAPFDTPLTLGAANAHSDYSNVRIKEMCIFNAAMTEIAGAFDVLETYITGEHGLTL